MLVEFAQFAPLIADFGWLKAIVLLVFFIIWIFNNLIGDKAKAKARPQRQQLPQPNGPEGKGAGGQKQLAGEIEDFLKRAGAKRQERARRKQPTKAVVNPAPTPPPKPVRRLVPSAAEPQNLDVATGRSVADHVQKHLDTRQFAERASHLGDEDIAKNDAERDAHRKQVFDHKLGRLADTSTGITDSAETSLTDAPTQPEPAAAVPLATLLSNPQNLKNAIVLNEILSRPEHRW